MFQYCKITVWGVAIRFESAKYDALQALIYVKVCSRISAHHRTFMKWLWCWPAAILWQKWMTFSAGCKPQNRPTLENCLSRSWQKISSNCAWSSYVFGTLRAWAELKQTMEYKVFWCSIFLFSINDTFPTMNPFDFLPGSDHTMIQHTYFWWKFITKFLQIGFKNFKKHLIMNIYWFCFFFDNLNYRSKAQNGFKRLDNKNLQKQTGQNFVKIYFHCMITCH